MLTGTCFLSLFRFPSVFFVFVSKFWLIFFLVFLFLVVNIWQSCSRSTRSLNLSCKSFLSVADFWIKVLLLSPYIISISLIIFISSWSWCYICQVIPFALVYNCCYIYEEKPENMISSLLNFIFPWCCASLNAVALFRNCFLMDERYMYMVLFKLSPFLCLDNVSQATSCKINWFNMIESMESYLYAPLCIDCFTLCGFHGWE